MPCHNLSVGTAFAKYSRPQDAQKCIDASNVDTKVQYLQQPGAYVQWVRCMLAHTCVCPIHNTGHCPGGEETCGVHGRLKAGSPKVINDVMQYIRMYVRMYICMFMYVHVALFVC